MAKKKPIKKAQCCGTCFFGKDAKVKRFDVDIYACRRFPPQQTGRQQSQDPYPYPMVPSTEWCGEYKPK